MGSKASGKTYSHESRVGRDQRVDSDLGVDVEHTGGTAGRPDNGGGVSLIVLEIVAVGGALELVGGGGLSYFLAF